jgi:hypothetical protein
MGKMVSNPYTNWKGEVPMVLLMLILFYPDNIFQVRIPCLLVLGQHFVDNIDEVLIGRFIQTIVLWIVSSRVSLLYAIVLEKTNQFGIFEFPSIISDDIS